MKKVRLKVYERELKGKGWLSRLRRSGMVPAILYGKDQEPLPISVVLRDIDRALSSESGFNVLFDLEFDGGRTVLARIREYQADPIKRSFSHIDFHKVDLRRKMVVEVAIEPIGESPGVKEGGILTLQRRTLEIKCLPDAVPDRIEVDVSGLRIGDSLHISEVKLPAGVELAHTDVDFTVLNILPPAKAVEAAAAAEAAPAEIEAAAKGQTTEEVESGSGEEGEQ